jgi:hypothetical protein
MATEFQPIRKRKPLAGWMIGLAAILLLVNVFATNFHFGILRALDLYPMDTAEIAGYDFARLLMFAFIIWVGWLLAASKILN